MKNFGHVLSEANKQKCIKLLGSMGSSQLLTSKTRNKAAVLVPLCKSNNQLALLYTVRAMNLKMNGGEVAFPGGRFDESDGNMERTALREAHEEVGISPQRVEIWGKGPEIHRSDVKVTPVLGFIGPLHLDELRINPQEVSSAFIVSLENLTSAKNFHVTRFRFGKNYIVKSPVYKANTIKIWGLTAYITHIILSSLVPEIYKKNIKFNSSVEKIIR